MNADAARGRVRSYWKWLAPVYKSRKTPEQDAPGSIASSLRCQSAPV